MTDKPRNALELYMKEFLKPETVAEIEAEVAKIVDLPAVVPLHQLKTPVFGKDPTELISNRFLYRGGVCLLCGPTGIGKSSFLMQLGIYLACGEDLFGISLGACYRGTGLRVLLIQAENDEGDLAEMRDGVLAGCADLDDEQRARAAERFLVCTINDLTGDRFAKALDGLFEMQGPFDVVLTDPAFAYLGGDASNQRDVSYFMRSLVNPLLQRYEAGMILAHHTNKPLRGKEKDGWAAGDYAYLGAGSAEWINPARAALVIRALGSDSVFELRAAKRGKRLRWTDAEGEPTNVQYIAHHRDAGVICWRLATSDEIEEVLSTSKGGRRKQYDDFECVHAVLHRQGASQAFYVDLVAGVLGCAKETARKMLKTCVDAGWVRERNDGRNRRYEATNLGWAEARQRPSTRNWANQ